MKRAISGSLLCALLGAATCALGALPTEAPASHRMAGTLKNKAAGFTGEAFPELRKVWDTPSALFPAAAASGKTTAGRASALAEGVPVSLPQGGSVSWVIRKRGSNEK